MNENATPLDITSFDAVKASDGGYEFELKDTDGMSGTGIYLTVIGRHSDAVVGWFSKTINANVRETQMAARKGKTVDPKSVEDNVTQNIELSCIRVVGWRNVAQEFTKDLLAKVLRRNPHWVDQITEQSDSLGNFTK
jgi:hypothetical protein